MSSIKEFLHHHQANIYLVGGAVRDGLLGLDIKDRDYVIVGQNPNHMIAAGFKQVGSDFPVFLDHQNQEYALARIERKSGSGYLGFVTEWEGVTLEDDLKRRDITINAMAQDKQGNLIDPYGGQQDLQKRIMRHVSEAFVEDPVRILRVGRFMARFAHLGFTIAPETWALICDMIKNDALKEIVTERFWSEFQRSLSEPSPQTFISLMQTSGALRVLWPELDKLWGIPKPPQWHPEIDTGVHTLMALERACQLSTEPEVRFAALCHDLGKGLTPVDAWPRHIAHEHRGG